MCGIVCVVSRPSSRSAPSPTTLLADLDAAIAAGRAGDLALCVERAGAADAALRGDAGLATLLDHADLVPAISARAEHLSRIADDVEATLESGGARSARELDVASGVVGEVRDAAFALVNDRIRTARLVADLAGSGAPRGAQHAYLSIQQAFAAIDRMEVRGRDSAGVHLLVWGHGVSPDEPSVVAMLGERSRDPLFTSRSVRPGADGRAWSFVYKAAAEIGELGDNTRAMRAAVASDDLLRHLLVQPGARVSVVGHTRWASVGIISEPNAHPVNSEELGATRSDRPYLVSVLNGDVDNHADLKARNDLQIADPITTDAKIIPTLMARRCAAGVPLEVAFRESVAGFDGSVAIATASADDPECILLALRGSGQGIYVGVAEDRFLVASEPYGVVEETARYLRLDGETPMEAGDPASRGQVAVLNGSLAGSMDGIALMTYQGRVIPIDESSLTVAEVTTRDIDRGPHRHFLAKEIAEAPSSVRKTIRGRIVDLGGQLRVDLGTDALPEVVRAGLAEGRISRVRVIGQGTAAIAGRSLAMLLGSLCGRSLTVDALTATELSGFHLGLDMSDTLVVAISQSGTTTDTNRTVDLARTRGAHVVAIVNRRGSELSAKADGVLYTSDGRDVEMSVASTKAFYSQVAAGALLACAIAESAGAATDGDRHRLLEALRNVPAAMTAVLEQRDYIAEVARSFAPSRRYWTVVGNGYNVVAAEEVRIKLSELCYKSIACDVTEDKKHIDLSCEPMIVVCATGLNDGTASDVAKEVAIYRAHKALPIVVTDHARFDAASAVIQVPRLEANLGFILAAVVGHLFGYEAAMAIDSLALPLRAAREVVEHAVERGGRGEDLLAKVRAEIGVPAGRFTDALATGNYDGNLEASTAVRAVTMLRDVTAPDPLQAYYASTGRVSTPEALLNDVTSALTRAIDELTRPVDAIKHQAKTVTVGISRSDEGLLDRALVKSVLEAGAPRDGLSYRVLKVVASLDPAVAKVVGFTRYRIDGDPSTDHLTVSIVDKGGVAREITSSVEHGGRLVGTKHRVVSEGNVLVARGRRDGRTVVFVPETKGSRVVGLTLLHVVFHDRLPSATMKSILQGYDNRYERLKDWVMETEGTFREDRLGEMSVADLLILPISDAADMWRMGRS